MASKERLTLAPKKKTSTGKKIMKAVVFMAAVNGSIKLISKYSSKKAKKDLAEGEYCYNLMMDGKQIRFQNQEVKKITLAAKMSGIDLYLSDIKEIDGLKIHCKAFMSGICIRVPKNVVVKNQIKEKLGAVAKSVPDYLEEGMPVIYISGSAYLSGVDIRLVEE